MSGAQRLSNPYLDYKVRMEVMNYLFGRRMLFLPVFAEAFLGYKIIGIKGSKIQRIYGFNHFRTNATVSLRSMVCK